MLAVGLATAVNLLLFGVVWDAVRSDTPGISENATQVIIAAFTGITGVLGGYIGGRAVERATQEERARHQEPTSGPSTAAGAAPAPGVGVDSPSDSTHPDPHTGGGGPGPAGTEPGPT